MYCMEKTLCLYTIIHTGPIGERFRVGILELWPQNCEHED